MSVTKDYLSALVFTNLDWVLSEFDITREKAKLLVSDLKILQDLDFIVQIKRKILKLQGSQSRYQISEKVGIPLSIVNQIISESRSLKQEEVQNNKQKDNKMLEHRNNNSIQLNDQNPNQQRQNINKKLKKTQKIQEDILQCYEEFLKVEEKQENTYNNKKRPRKEIKKEIIILSDQTKLNAISKQDPQNLQISIQNIKQTQNKEIDLYSKIQSFEQKEDQENQQNQSQLQNKEIIRLTKSGIVFRESEDKQLFACLYCDQIYNEGIVLSKHFIDHHAQEKLIYLFCPLCQNLTFENSSLYSSHLKDHQRQGEIVKYTLQQIKTFQFYQTKKINQLTQKENSLGKVEKQEKLQGKQEPEKIVKGKIENISNDKSILLIQTRKHQCAECEKNFPEEEQLILHQKTHEKKNLNYRLKTSKTYVELQRENTALKHGTIIYNEDDSAAYKCKECESTFKTNKKLQKHFDKNHPNAQFNTIKCMVCQGQFNERKNLLKHLTGHSLKEYKKLQITDQQEEIQINKKSKIEKDIQQELNLLKDEIKIDINVKISRIQEIIKSKIEEEIIKTNIQQQIKVEKDKNRKQDRNSQDKDREDLNQDEQKIKNHAP